MKEALDLITSTQEVKARRSQVKNPPELKSNFEASLGYVKSYLRILKSQSLKKDKSSVIVYAQYIQGTGFRERRGG